MPFDKDGKFERNKFVYSSQKCNKIHVAWYVFVINKQTISYLGHGIQYNSKGNESLACPYTRKAIGYPVCDVFLCLSLYHTISWVKCGL